MDETELLRKRLTELNFRSESRGVWEYSDFLSLSEQSELISLRLSLASLFGGYAFAERKIAVFGSEDQLGYAPEIPISCVRIEPVSRKFSQLLTHRDYLGSLMALGIERSLLGDIIIDDLTAYVICLEKIAPFIASELAEVKRTAVKCAVCEIPDKAAEKPPVTSSICASERLDAIISGVYGISRSESKRAVEGGIVFLDGKRILDPSSEVREGTIVSVRGTGRFIYEGIERETRSGRLHVQIRKY